MEETEMREKKEREEDEGGGKKELRKTRKSKVNRTQEVNDNVDDEVDSLEDGLEGDLERGGHGQEQLVVIKLGNVGKHTGPIYEII